MAENKTAKKTPARTADDKSKAFNELATARVNKALKAMRQIKYLANPTTYTYSKESVETILNVLLKSLTEIRDAFSDPKAAKSEGFKLG